MLWLPQGTIVHATDFQAILHSAMRYDRRASLAILEPSCVGQYF